MVHSRATLLYSLIILLTAVSCSFLTSSATPSPSPVSAPPASPVPTEFPTVVSTLSSSPAPNISPTATAASTNLHLPNGIATFSASNGTVTYFDLQGVILGSLKTPNMGTGTFQQAAVAGSLTYSPAPVLPPLMYYASENEGELWLNDNDNASLIVAAPNLFDMIGSPGKSLVAYSRLEYNDVGLRSLVFLSDLKNLATASSIMDNTNTEGYAIKPLVISSQNDQPVGLWYTMVPYGIGGNIVFEPRKTLNYLDLAAYQTKTYLDMSNCPVGISDDQTWVAYTSADGTGPVSIIHNFDIPSAITFPLRSDSNRGAGEAVFSADNHYVAWKEATGSLTEQPPTFQQTIRIATVDGNIITELSDSALVNASGFTEIGWVVPIGWLDTETLALEVRDISGDNVNILSVKYDGSNPTLLASGSFIGFLYP